MKTLREMHIKNGKELMYGKYNGINIEDLPDFFSDNRLNNNSIVYDEENEGFIIDIKNYTPSQIYHEYYRDDKEVLNSIIGGPLLLKMDELNKEENAQVKQVICELFQICEEYRRFIEIVEKNGEIGDLPTDLDDAKVYYDYLNKRTKKMEDFVGEQRSEYFKPFYYGCGAVISSIGCAVCVVASCCNMMPDIPANIIGGGTFFTSIVLAITSYGAKELSNVSSSTFENNKQILKKYKKYLEDAKKRYNELLNQETSPSLTRR